MTASQGIKTLRGLLSELRLASPNGTIKDSLAANYILKQFKKYKTTDLQLCREKDEVMYLGSTYLCYLRSIRRQHEIHMEYHARGERSVADTAKLVGFKLPHEPK